MKISKSCATAVALVHLYQGKSVTDSLAIARKFRRAHKNVFQSRDALIADGTINQLEFRLVKFVDAKGENRSMIELTKRGALIAMPFIGGKNSRAGQVRLVDAFLAMRDELANHPSSEWNDARIQVSASFRAMPILAFTLGITLNRDMGKRVDLPNCS